MVQTRDTTTSTSFLSLLLNCGQSLNAKHALQNRSTIVNHVSSLLLSEEDGRNVAKSMMKFVHSKIAHS